MPALTCCGPASCAENMAASPQTTTLPLPQVIKAACDHPLISVKVVDASKTQAVSESSRVLPSGKVRIEEASGGRVKACPVNDTAVSTVSPSLRPRVMMLSPRVPSLRMKNAGPGWNRVPGNSDSARSRRTADFYYRTREHRDVREGDEGGSGGFSVQAVQV